MGEFVPCCCCLKKKDEPARSRCSAETLSASNSDKPRRTTKRKKKTKSGSPSAADLYLYPAVGNRSLSEPQVLQKSREITIERHEPPQRGLLHQIRRMSLALFHPQPAPPVMITMQTPTLMITPASPIRSRLKEDISPSPSSHVKRQPSVDTKRAPSPPKRQTKSKAGSVDACGPDRVMGNPVKIEARKRESMTRIAGRTEERNRGNEMGNARKTEERKGERVAGNVVKTEGRTRESAHANVRGKEAVKRPKPGRSDSLGDVDELISTIDSDFSELERRERKFTGIRSPKT